MWRCADLRGFINLSRRLVDLSRSARGHCFFVGKGRRNVAMLKMIGENFQIGHPIDGRGAAQTSL